jgi:hypothetical protein
MTTRDFPQGLQRAADYLNAVHHKSGTIISGIDGARVAVSAEYSFSLRELLCGMLSGNGVKLPNIQICMQANIQALLGIPNIQGEVADALTQLLGSVEDFMDHTKIDNVLGRLNNVLGEVQNIANMINFCAQPVDPIAIPNMLERTMGSYLGAGKQLANEIGSMQPGNIGGCLSTDGGFNTNVFNGGVLGRISNRIQALTDGSLAQNEIDSFKNDIASISRRMTNLIAFENNINGSYGQGGSQFSTPDPDTNSEIGVLHNPQNASVGSTARVTSQMKALYDNLAAYPVQYSLGGSSGIADGGHQYDSNGDRILQGDIIEYPNIFHLLFDDELLKLLQNADDPSPDVSNQTPVFDYCGNVIGYTTKYTQKEIEKSEGVVPTTPSSPGANAGGFITDTTTASGSNSISNTTVINNFSGSGADLYIVNSESGMLSLQAKTDDIVVRSDILTLFVRKNTNTSNTGTIDDFEQATSTLFQFLNNLNVEQADGIIVKDSGISRARKVEGNPGETVVFNGDGRSGNIRVQLEENTVIPGNAAIRIPVGNTSQRPNTQRGEVRYNTDSERLEGYFGPTSTWQSVALLSDLASSNTSITNIGSGSKIFKNVVNNNNELRTLTGGSGIQITEQADDILISDQITSSNIGTGTQVFKQRSANNFEFRSLVSTDNSITFTQNNNTVDISGDPNVKKASLTTTDASATDVQFNNVYSQPAVGKTWFFTAFALARANTGQVQSFKIEGTVDNQTGTPTIVGNTISKTDYQRSTSDAITAIWDPMTTYTTGESVEYDGNIYEANTAVAGNELSPDQNSNWTVTYTGWNFTAQIVSNNFRVKVKGDSTAASVDWDVRFTFLEV